MASTSTYESTGLLRGQHEIPIYYEDTDFSGFVYHANYLKFFERAREHLIGIDFLQDLYRDGLHFVVSQASLKFKRPAKHGDFLLIDSEVHYSRSPVLRCKQNCLNPRAERTQDKLLCSAEIDLVILNHLHRPVRLPESVIKVFKDRPASPYE